MKVLKILINFIIFFISLFIPKSCKYIVIGGWYGKRYADNSKGMFEYLDDNKDELGLKKVFWHTKSKGIYNELKSQGKDVLYGMSWRSIWWHFRSKVHMIDDTTHDILGFLSVRCIRIDLWHGVPIKTFGYMQKGHEGPSKGIRKFIDYLSSGGYWDDRLVLATSEFTRNLLSKAKNQPKDKFIIASYPRNIHLYDKETRLMNNRIAFYLPTFRNNSNRNPVIQIDFVALNEMLKLHNIHFWVKPHFADISDWEKKGSFSNIKILRAQDNVYDWLHKTELLITDYSSVFYDFLLTGHPVLFFPYDYEYYMTEDRGFVLPYNENTPGDKVYDTKELFNSIVYIFDNTSEYLSKYDDSYNKILNKTNKFTQKPNFDSLLKAIKIK